MDNIICIAGKNNIAVDILYYALNELKLNKDLLCIIPNKTDSGKDSWQKSLIYHAEKNNIKITTLQDLYEIENLIFLSLEFDRIIKPEKFKSEKLYNIHFSDLPKFKGMYTSVMPILNGEKQAGVTFHKIDSGIDTGDIIKQKLFSLPISFTARDLYFSYIENGTNLIKEVLYDVLIDNIKTVPQAFENSTYYSKSTIDFNNIIIDFKKTSYEIHNQIRAFIFKEYQLPKINNHQIYKSVLTGERIGFNHFEELDEMFIISGIDGFKIKAYKNQDFCSQKI